MSITFKNAVVCLGIAVAFILVAGCVTRDNGTKSPTGTQVIDTDNDGIPNNIDPDIDGDGIPNNQDPDMDNDGTPNNQDSDMDNDGDPNNYDPDIDGDGTPNNQDSDMDGDGTPNDTDPDKDGDATPNNQDATPDGTVDTSKTNPDKYVPGLSVAAVDTFDYDISIPSGSTGKTFSSTEIIQLKDVRDEINKNGIVLSTFSITDLIISAKGSSFIQTNSNTKVVVTVSYLDANNNKILMLESAAQSGLAGPVLSLGNLTQGISLNKEIFGSKPGYTNFTDMIKDQSTNSISTVVELAFLDNVPQTTADVPLSFVIKVAGKKAF